MLTHQLNVCDVVCFLSFMRWWWGSVFFSRVRDFPDTIHLGVNGSDDPFFTTASRLDLEPTTAGPHELSPG